MGNYSRVCLGAGSGGEDSSYGAYHAFLLLHLGFGILCLIEMILRAMEQARRIVFDNHHQQQQQEHQHY